MADVLYDVSVVVDICAERQPFATEAFQVEQVCRRSGFPVRLYTGSVQTMQYTVATELKRIRMRQGWESFSFSKCLADAAAAIQVFSTDKHWVAALSEDGAVLSADDPEDEQLRRALSRLPDGALLVTRDARLLEREDRAVSPTEFLSRYSQQIDPDPPAFVDLHRQLDRMRPEMERAVWTAIESTRFINGPEVKQLESELAAYVGVKHAIGCSSGTDALTLGMMALGVRPGDEVIVPDFSFFATAETVGLLGATPVFADIRPDTFNIDPASIESAVTDKTVGIIPVSLYGQPADMDEINEIAERHNLWVMEDAAQSFGATYKGRKSCALSRIAATSFFPAKPLGCYGDGGAVFTDEDELAERVRMILNHGQRKRYDHALLGLNARLDTVQAAVLRVKLARFDDELESRRRVADRYSAALSNVGGSVSVPVILDHNTSTWAQYTLRVTDRESLQSRLKERNIPSSVHYPIPLHRQEALARSEGNRTEMPNAQRAAAEVISLPMHPYLSEQEIARITEAITDG